MIPFFRCCRKQETEGADAGASRGASFVASVFASLVAMGTGMGFLFDFNIRSPFQFLQPVEQSSVSFVDTRSRERLVNLRGEWRFSIGDDPGWAERDFDDRDWGEISVPSNWEGEGYGGYNGFAWYRRSFDIDAADLTHSLHLLLGRIDDVDEVYVNGRRIGGTGQFEPDYVTAYNVDRVYFLPDGLLESGHPNVIAVRVYDGAQAGGVISGTIGIYSSDLPQPLIDLSGVWRLRMGDNSTWSKMEADESEFEHVNVPGYWDHSGHDRFDGHAWYRKSFQLSSIPENETMVLLLGKVDDFDKTYLNGTEIGGTGIENDPAESGADTWRERRAYEFPSSLLKANNTIAVRVFDGQGYGGIYEGPIGIMTKADHDLYWEVMEDNRGEFFKPMFDWLLGRN